MNNKHRSTRKHTAAQKKAVERHRINPSLKIVPLVKENPRRTGTEGYKSMAVILKNKGITVEEFLEKRPNRSRDLRWDIEAGNVKLAGKAS